MLRSGAYQFISTNYLVLPFTVSQLKVSQLQYEAHRPGIRM